jgi:pSer/pThr/pTyr-binding forkhead associated (FHA) protein
MTVREALDLTTFAAALNQLAAQIDNTGSDEKLIADASVALCSGIIAMAVFQSAPIGEPVADWDGSLDDHTLCLFSPTHQLVFTLANNMFQAAVLSGPSGNTWNINRSEKGLHVQVVDIDAEVVKDRLIKNDGNIVDAADTSSAMQELQSEMQRIANLPEDSLPAYVPSVDLIDVDLPDINSLPDVNSDLPEDSDVGDSGDSSGSGGSFPDDDSSFPFPDDLPADSGFASKAADMAKNLAKGAAVAAVAGVVAKAAQAAGRSSSSSTPPAPVLETSDLVLVIADGEPVEINEFPCLLGRGNDCHLVLSSRLVSRKHAKIDRQDGQILFEDLGSSNGSWLNGEKCREPVSVYRDDELKLADIVIKVVEGPTKTPPENGNLPTMMFNLSESAQKTGQIPAVKTAEPEKPSLPAASPPPQKKSAVEPSKQPPPPPPPAPASKKAVHPPPHKPASPAPVAPPKAPRQGARPQKSADSPPPPVPSSRPAPPPPPTPEKQVEPVESDEDYIARAIQAARGRNAKAAPAPAKHAPPPAMQAQPAAGIPGHAADQIKPATPEDYRVLPSVRWVSFIFGIFFVVENLRALVLTNGDIASQQSFILAGGAGCALVLFAFIAGSGRGFFRFLTLVSSGAYVGIRLYHEHARLWLLVKQLETAADDPIIIVPLLSIATAIWISKRAANR